MSLVLDKKYPIGGADHAGLAARARELRADLFVGGGYTDDAVAFTRAASDVGYSPLLSNPRTGEPVEVPARDVPVFEPSRHLRSRVDRSLGVLGKESRWEAVRAP